MAGEQLENPRVRDLRVEERGVAETEVPIAGFMPRSLGISVPEGKDVYEVYLRVRSTPSILGKVSNLFGSKNIDILGVHGQVSGDKKFGDLIFYVDVGGSTASTAEVIDELERQSFVVSATSHPRNSVYFEANTFPLTSGGHYRVFVLGANGWASLVKSMLDRFGSGGKFLLREAGVAFGREMVSGIGSRFSSADSAVLIDNLKALLRASGLGLMEITGDRVRNRLMVEIKEPVISPDGGATTTDDFLIGAVKGAVSKIYSRDYKVARESYRDKTLAFELLSP
jgi:glycine cleavage system regulatory protein